MEKQKYFRIALVILLGLVVVMLVWFRGQWSTVQLCCFTVLFLAAVAVLVNNQRNEAFERAASFVMLAALLANQWTQIDTRTPRGKIHFAILAAFFTWLVTGPWFRKKKTLPDSDDSRS
jgi:Na+-translocating ferredoxin:NAD+ oxidoreductase RnfD subunit